MTFSKPIFFGLLIIFILGSMPRGNSFEATSSNREANGGVLIQDEGKKPQACYDEKQVVDLIIGTGMAAYIEKHISDDVVIIFAVSKTGAGITLPATQSGHYCEMTHMPPRLAAIYAQVAEDDPGTKIEPLYGRL